MKKLLTILALCAGSLQAQDLGPLDRYWAQRGYYRNEGDTFYQRDRNGNVDGSVYLQAEKLKELREEILEIQQQNQKILEAIE